jgi:hypothetical protein
MMVIDNKYEIGSIVYLITDSEQLKRIVLSFECYKNGEILYKIACGTTLSYHYEFELSFEKDIEIITGIE